MTTTLEPAAPGRRPLVPGAFRRQRMPRRRGRRVFSRKQRMLFSVLNLTAFFVVWQLVATYGSVPTMFLPSVTDVFDALVEMHQEGILWGNLGISLSIYLIGMVISLAIAIPAGLLIGGIPMLDKALSTYVWALYTMPRIVLMPTPAALGRHQRCRTDLDHRALGRAGHARGDHGRHQDRRQQPAGGRPVVRRQPHGSCSSRSSRPSTVPFIATGVRMGVSRGLLGLFIGEVFTGVNGIGYIITLAQKNFDSAELYAMLLIFVLFCVALVSATQWLERKVMEGRRQLY